MKFNCHICQHPFERTADNFRRYAYNKDGLSYNCKGCARQISRICRENRFIKDPEGEQAKEVAWRKNCKPRNRKPGKSRAKVYGDDRVRGGNILIKEDNGWKQRLVNVG